VDIVIKTILIISKDRQITKSNYKNKKLKFFWKKILKMSFQHAFSKLMNIRIIKKKIEIHQNLKEITKIHSIKESK
jgi:flagellar biosynthesis/type III secretory pathway chaperone